MEYDKQMNLRVSRQQHDRWKEVAGPQPLAAWIRDTLDEAAEPLPPRKEAESHEDHR